MPTILLRALLPSLMQLPLITPRTSPSPVLTPVMRRQQMVGTRVEGEWLVCEAGGQMGSLEGGGRMVGLRSGRQMVGLLCGWQMVDVQGGRQMVRSRNG